MPYHYGGMSKKKKKKKKKGKRYQLETRKKVKRSPSDIQITSN